MTLWIWGWFQFATVVNQTGSQCVSRWTRNGYSFQQAVLCLVFAELRQRHRGQFSNICYSLSKTRPCPSCPERNEHSYLLLLCTHHSLCDVKKIQKFIPIAFSHWKDRAVFRALFLSAQPLHLCCWVAKIHSSLLDLPQIGSVLSRPREAVLSAYLSHQFQPQPIVGGRLWFDKRGCGHCVTD